MRLRLHPGKTRLHRSTDPVGFLGFVLRQRPDGGVSVRLQSDNIPRFRARMQETLTLYDAGAIECRAPLRFVTAPPAKAAPPSDSPRPRPRMPCPPPIRHGPARECRAPPPIRHDPARECRAPLRFVTAPPANAARFVIPANAGIQRIRWLFGVKRGLSPSRTPQSSSHASRTKPGWCNHGLL